MDLDVIVVALAIGGGALAIGQVLPQFVPPEWENYAILLAGVLWAALVLGVWKRWQNR
jgi:hypothetical protein